MKKHGIMEGRGIEDLIHIILLSISFYFQFIFYIDMLVPLLLAGLTFELMKPNFAQEGWKTRKTSKGKVILFVLAVVIALSLMATSSSLVNNYTKLVDNGKENIQTKKWTDNKKLEIQSKKNVENLEKQLNDYPSLETFTKNIPNDHSTNLAKVTDTWSKGKQAIQDSLNKANNEFNSILKRYEGIEQFENIDTNDKYKSYTKLFSLIGDMLKVNPEVIAIIIFFIISILLEVGIIISKDMAINARLIRLGLIKETLEERLKRHNEELAEKNFNDMIKKQLPDTDLTVPSKPLKFKIKPKTNDKRIIDFNKKKVNKEKKYIIDNKPAKKFEKKEIDHETIKEYFNYLVQNSNDNIAIGYKKVASEIGITQSEAKRIYDYLVKNNYLIKIDQRKTKIINNFMKEGAEN